MQRAPVRSSLSSNIQAVSKSSDVVNNSSDSVSSSNEESDEELPSGLDTKYSKSGVEQSDVADDVDDFQIPPPPRGTRDVKLSLLSQADVAATVSHSEEPESPARKRKFTKKATAVAQATVKEKKKKKKKEEKDTEEIPLHGLLGSIKKNMYSAKGLGPSMVKVAVADITAPDPAYKCRKLYPENHAEVSYFNFFYFYDISTANYTIHSFTIQRVGLAVGSCFVSAILRTSSTRRNTA